MKKIISILIVAAVSTAAMAVPARRDGMMRTAADGTEKMVYLHGNEHFHYMTDEAGNWLDEESLLPISEEQKNQRLEARERKMRRIAQQQQIGGEPNIAPRGLVILVNFQDKAFVTPYDTMNNMMNGENFMRSFPYSYNYNGRHYEGVCTSTGSARKYFQDQSYGQYNPVFDVVGPYTVSGNTATYGANSGGDGTDKNVGQLIKEACELADANGANFTLYDNNGDNYVDFVYVIYAGEGEADGGGANTIWPHNWKLNYWNKSCTVDGKKISNYACSNEMNHCTGVYAGIGTFVHEFGHVIGLPDFYETNNPSQNLTTLNEWDIMDYGCYNNEGETPPAYSAYERFYCGWLQPRVLTDPENVTLHDINSGSGESLMLCEGNTHNLVGHNPLPRTFYLLENRQLTGWDQYLAGPGMLITKVTYNASNWANNSVNNSATNMGVDIIEARTNTSMYGAATDVYPAGATSWTGFANHEITNIQMTQTGDISFAYRGGTTTENIAIESQQPESRKVLRDGQILIIRNGKTYTILGHENH